MPLDVRITLDREAPVRSHHEENSALDENSNDLKIFGRFKPSVILSGCVCFGFYM